MNRCACPNRAYRVCGMGPPTSGGLTSLMILGLLEPYHLGRLNPEGLVAAHLFSQASRLAFADRNQYMADADFIDVPVAGLLDRDYLRSRSRLINPVRDSGSAAPGTPPGSVEVQTGGGFRPDRTWHQSPGDCRQTWQCRVHDHERRARLRGAHLPLPGLC